MLLRYHSPDPKQLLPDDITQLEDEPTMFTYGLLNTLIVIIFIILVLYVLFALLIEIS